MMGSKFVEKVRDYLLSVGEEVQGIAIIPSNPDQSKHLETARMRILNVWVDFVNLRCEEYSDDSRIPTMQKYGTPEQDALRRDLTINSLFYNINTKSIEDWTNRGVEDLKCGKIASPLPPKDTFMEDPLRVLRAIRFGARFGFILDEQLKEAAACDEVKAALSAKISREQIGAEIDLMMSGNQPAQAMTYICDLKLFWVVFSLHPQCEPSEGCDSDCVAYLDCTWNLIQLVGHSTFNEEQRRLSFYAAMFLPHRKTVYKDRKAKDVPVVNYIFRDSLKQRVSDAETVINLHNALEKFLSLLPHFVPNGDVKLAEVDLGREYVDVPLTSKESKLRVLTGFLLQEIKDFWRVALLMSTLLYPTNVLDKNLKPEDRRALFVEAEKAINNLGLDKVWDVKPLLNGKEIMDALQLKSGGPLVSKWLSMVIIQEASSSSSSSTHPWKYHVFLSFRGEDTRNNFTGHLCSALRQKGINTFMDDQLRRGEEISTALLQAIEQSRISIIVFSKNYASSRWCLDELVKILDCRRTNQQEVRPVFYKVDPSDIRNHRGSFGEALANHECKFKDNPDKVRKWKSALSEAANLSGWPLLDEHCSESNVINQIVEEISVKVIERTYLEVTKYPVGIESRVQNVHRLLGVEGKDVHMVGIWGTGGIGKTTIAKAVYNSIAHEFDGSCFLENVRENSMHDRGFIKLQKTLLFEILGGTKLKVANVARGINMIKDRLQYKRVLLVLDDVNDMDQLNKLAGDPSWFGMGSKIIITTRDKELLTGHNVNLIYEVKELAHHEALELFSRNAFKGNRPLDGFEELTERAIRYAQGLPLALSVLGSSLCGGSVEKWKAALEGFKSPTIRKVLQISYEGLDDTVKEIFLDIACFFKGEYTDHVIQALEASRRKPAKYGINVLIDKALINTSTGHIWMHDLLEELGRDIVHKESPNDPGKRSRLWFHEDVYRVLTENTGTTNVIGIKVKLPKDSDVICLSGTTFSNMRNLRLFIHCAGRCSGAVDSLPNSLRVVDWPEYPLQFLPSNLIQRELAVINMPRSRITVLGDGYKHLVNLTSINLSCCQYLTKVSDLSGSPNLRRLNLDYCKSLVEVHSSVGFLDKLEYLSLSDCSRLETFLTEVNWKSMRTLMLPSCRRLENFIKIGHSMESIKTLDLMESGIKELQSWIGCCISLEVLNLHGTSIKQLPSSEIENLTSLRELDLWGTPLEELPSSIGYCTSLEILNAYGTDIEELPSSIGYCTSLCELNLSGTLIEELPSSIGNLTSLVELNVSKTPIKNCLLQLGISLP
ncbi:disease resistance protein RPV1-like isoform X2 [Rosa rugosa]|nr:disease resistance protein RPV1-like isoform X2 [Rosa rugosa]XP_061990790.1 disease resistance protein RPV1-like isoform X2 [Rosa rugosa]XP_061990791.1 disease resistance protein RPV1-like isoform X2 [Rosa rugosa]